MLVLIIYLFVVSHSVVVALLLRSLDVKPEGHTHISLIKHTHTHTHAAEFVSQQQQSELK